MADAIKLKMPPGLRAALRRVADIPKLWREFGEYKASAVKRGFQRGSRSASAIPGKPPFSRSGGRGLLGSITYLVRGLRLMVGTNKRYGAMIQFGGVQRPRKARALTIPVHPKARGKRARDFNNLTLIPSRPGADSAAVGVLARVTNAGRKNEKIEPYFALRTSVTIRPHPFLRWLKVDFDKLFSIIKKRSGLT